MVALAQRRRADEHGPPIPLQLPFCGPAHWCLKRNWDTYWNSTLEPLAHHLVATSRAPASEREDWLLDIVDETLQRLTRNWPPVNARNIDAYLKRHLNGAWLDHHRRRRRTSKRLPLGVISLTHLGDENDSDSKFLLTAQVVGNESNALNPNWQDPFSKLVDYHDYLHVLGFLKAEDAEIYLLFEAYFGRGESIADIARARLPADASPKSLNRTRMRITRDLERGLALVVRRFFPEHAHLLERKTPESVSS